MTDLKAAGTHSLGARSVKCMGYGAMQLAGGWSRPYRYERTTTGLTSPTNSSARRCIPIRRTS
jgi:hypothetical protein